MLKYHIKIAWRNLLRQKELYLINVIGLSIGIASCLTIMLVVADELSYDRYNEHAEQIVRVVLKAKVNDETLAEAVTPAPVAKTLQQEFPEVLQGTRLKDSGTPKITYEENTFRDSKMAFVDANFFQVFTLPMLSGNPKTALNEPNSMVITREEALKFFGTADAVGKILDLKESNRQYKVTGVIQNVPDNSHFHFDVFASMEGLEDAKKPNWVQSNGYYNYLLLDSNNNIQRLEQKLPVMVEKYMGPQLQSALGMTYAEFNESGNEVGLYLQPLTDIHLRSDFSEITELEEGGDIQLVYIFSAVAIFILVIAIINFMNLSTAGASKRAREVGVKKVFGSKKSQLVSQFLIESFMVTSFAVIMALSLIITFLPYFNDLSGKSLEIINFLSPRPLVYLIIFVIFISILAGSYPAFFLSSFKPIAALKHKLTNTGKTKYIRRGLVVFQFIISVTLIISTIVADQQVSFIFNKDLGYNKDQILVIRDSWMLRDKEALFKERISNDARVARITNSGYIPAGPTNSGIYVVTPDQQPDAYRRTAFYYVDDQYLPTMGMQLVSGRNFENKPGYEQNSAIINETAARIYGFSDNALDQSISIRTDNGQKNYTIIGVVKDFHYKSLHRQIEPLIMFNGPNSGLIIKAKTTDIAGLLTNIKDMWDEFDVGEPFHYAFLDDLYYQTYLNEQKVRNVLRLFAGLTIFVACLGLFGLVTFTTEQRFKEIGIRKVLGATVPQIIAMLSKDFLKLVTISFLVAFPLGFYLMNYWLEDFAYRIEITWWVFPLTGLIAMLIAFSTLSFKSIKAANVNPVNCLKNE